MINNQLFHQCDGQQFLANRTTTTTDFTAQTVSDFSELWGKPSNKKKSAELTNRLLKQLNRNTYDNCTLSFRSSIPPHCSLSPTLLFLLKTISLLFGNQMITK